jgi:hypothetical protein
MSIFWGKNLTKFLAKIIANGLMKLTTMFQPVTPLQINHSTAIFQRKVAKMHSD